MEENRERQENAGRRLARYRRKHGRRDRMAGQLARVPFLLVCLCFVLSGMEELLPAAGVYGILWTVTALLVLGYAVYSLAARANAVQAADAPAEAEPLPDGAELSGAALLRRVDELLGPLPAPVLDTAALDFSGLNTERFGGLALSALELEYAGLDEAERSDWHPVPVGTQGALAMSALALEHAGLEEAAPAWVPVPAEQPAADGWADGYGSTLTADGWRPGYGSTLTVGRVRLDATELELAGLEPPTPVRRDAAEPAPAYPFTAAFRTLGRTLTGQRGEA